MNVENRLYRVGSVIAIAAMLLAAVGAPALSPFGGRAEASGPTTVFINEIHYDNASTDTGEAIEIAGPAGTDLTGWSVVLYNGSGGTVYNTTVLSGTLSDAGDGYGFAVLTYPSNGIQNGSPDGLALIDAISNVVQFLSYEGTFSATDGPAVGMSSTDIGVGEGSSTPVGDSLQLTGTGLEDQDFTWATSMPGTFGAVNTGQSFGEPGPTPTPSPTPEPTEPPTTPALVINEIDYDQASTDTSEYVEIKNNDALPVDLSHVTLELVNGSGGGAAIYNSISLPATTLAPGDYFVVCANAATVPNCDLDASPDTNFIQNGSPDAVGLRYDGSLVDAVSYEGDAAATYTEGSGAGLDDDPSVDNAGISRYPDGADTDQNNVDFGLHCDTPGEANVAAASDCVPAAEPVINEFSASTTGADVEYLELYGDPNTDYSAYSILQLKGDSASDKGAVDSVTSVGTTNSSGFWLGDLASNTLENGTITLFLVKDFSGSSGNDLDTNDDGALDSTPWSEVVDAVAVNDGGSGDLTYGVPVLGPNYDGVSGFAPGGASRIPDGQDTDTAADWVRNDFDLAGIPGHAGSIVLGEAYNTPGAPNEIYVPPPEACGDPFTPIYNVQGDSTTSPLVGTEVAIEGVVVGDFQNGGASEDGDLSGFYVQDPVGDGNAATSDGVFVYAPGGLDVSDGDGVRVRGNVSEYHGLTEIGASQIWQCSTDNSVAPTALALPVSGPDEFEAYEGMLVTFAQPLVISEYYNYDRYGEIVLTGTRHLTPTAEFAPGSADEMQAVEDYALDHITLDDGLSSQNPDTVRHPDGTPFTLDHRFRGGDILTNVTGVMDSFDAYRIQPTQGADYTAANPRPASPASVGGDLKVASFNVLNYFATIDTGALICGPSGDMECRGADNETELTRQRDKIIAAINAMDADVVGLIEIQNDDDTSVANLVSGLNTLIGDAVYDYVPTGFIGTDAIKLAIIYKPGSVTPVGSYAILDSSVDPRFIDTKNRPALAQTFMDNTTGGVFTLAVNHLKSKGSDCNDLGDPDLGDGAGNCNLTRTHAAEALVDWLAGDPTGSGSPNYLIMGDLNSYDHETPIDAIKAGPDGVEGTTDDYADLVFQSLGENAYSYVFDGQIGYLDSALASAAMTPLTTGATIWHINADEPDILDYDTTYKSNTQDALYAPDPYRSSDHDPVIVGVNVCEMVPPTLSLSVSLDSLWPANHKLTMVTVTPTVSDNFDPNPSVSLLSVTSNEPDDGLGDGDTANDIQIVTDLHILLRAERSGKGEGRTYTLTYQAMDACGNSTISTIDVSVPKSQGKKE